MIKTEIYKTLSNGTKLIRTYSDTGHYIIQNDTGIEYSEAVDPISMNRTYSESDRIIEEIETEWNKLYCLNPMKGIFGCPFFYAL